MNEAAAADRVVVMDNGSIIMDGAPREIFARSEELHAVGLDLPQPSELCGLLRKAGVQIEPGVLTAEECADALEKLLPASGHAPIPEDDTTSESADGDIIISTDKLSYTYSPGTPFRKDAIDEISVDIRRGEFVGIIGHTGSGKSTFVQQLNGLLRPTSGKILLEGKDIWDDPKKIRAVRFRVGLVFQYPEHQLFESTVYKDIAFGPGNMEKNGDELDEMVRSAAHAVRLREELLSSSPFDLSGGEKRRAAIAGVLAMRPQVLILDEPTAGLDPAGRDNILEMVENYRCESGATVILVSHNMEDVARVADRVLVMSHGRVAMLDDTRKVFSRGGELEEMGLSVPAVTRVFMLLAQRGIDLGTDVYTMEQAVTHLLPMLAAKGGDGNA